MAWKIVRTLGPGYHSLGPVALHFDQDGIGWTDDEAVAEKARCFPKIFKVFEIRTQLSDLGVGPPRPPEVFPETATDDEVPVPGLEDTSAALETSSPSELQATLDSTSLPAPGTWTEEVLGRETVPTLRKIAELLNVELSPNTRKSDLIELLMIAQEEAVLPDPSATPPVDTRDEGQNIP